MKKCPVRFLICILILSLSLPSAAHHVLAEGEVPSAALPTGAEPEYFEANLSSIHPEPYPLRDEHYPHELAERYPHEAEEPELREPIPPSPEVLALTQQQVQSFDCATVTDVPKIECEALVALYNSTNGAGWTDSSNWLTGTTVGTWYGVTVSSGHVDQLYLLDNQLSGPIPPELGNLSGLWQLDLSVNQLSGPIPSELGNLSDLLYLGLFYNQLSGPIPSELGSMTSLEGLYLFDNQLSGPIPPELGSMTSLEELDLFDNQLSGPIPPELGSLSNLLYLFLLDNQLSGPIPSELGNITNLLILALSDNQLSGPIPSELGSMTSLEGLDLFDNQLSGPIPPELGSMTSLEWLDLSDNQLSGPIPSELGSMTSLKGLYLSDNQLSGPIPSELGNLSGLWGLWELDLSDNQLSGPIPSELGNLNGLWQLDLSDNQLSGPIPSELGSMTSLKGLDLSQNALTGDVPASFTSLVNLCVEGDQDPPCYGFYKTDFGYNHLNVPAPEPPASFLAIKDPDWYLTQAVEEDIPPATGGTLISNDGNTEIFVPPGAAEGTLTLLFDPQPDPSHATGGLNFAGNSFELTARIGETPVTSFGLPLTITLYYDPDLLGPIPEGSLILYYWDIDQLAWVDAVSTCVGGEYTRDLEANWLSLPICHLSEFALLGDSFDLFLPVIRR